MLHSNGLIIHLNNSTCGFKFQGPGLGEWTGTGLTLVAVEAGLGLQAPLPHGSFPISLC